MTTVTIAPDAGVLTMIHTYHTEPGTQQAVYDGLLKGLELYGGRMAGHLTSTIHRSLDGLRVTSYSQWDPVASKALFEDPAALKESLDWFAPLTAAAKGQDAHVYAELSVYRP
ncbi:hypothetical protein ACE7GA_17295 [Roseomonas sp. CCTCC AB2023176]|uniref:hypothetical protein n=1 Tax=Roseomonas sp. CCTCC AB2023176 TaxID=3342640 RepID=UPI0035E28342